MKVRKRTVRLAVIFTVCIVLSMFAFAADNTYDSTKDPIAAKSYVDAQVNGLEAEINSLTTKINALEAEVKGAGADNDKLEAELNTLKTEISALRQEFEGIKNGSGFSYVSVKLTKGQTIYANNGTLEIILRTGSAVVVSPFTDGTARQGLFDTTKGVEIYNGGSVSLNDLCLIPTGGDGRGLKATSNEVYLLVRGSYEIK